MNIGEQVRQIRIWRALIARNDGRKCTCAWCQRACEELDLLETELLDYITYYEAPDEEQPCFKG